MGNGMDLALLGQLAKGIATQFGQNCEVVVHDLRGSFSESSIVIIENGHVTGRKLGDGPSHVVLETLRGDHSALEDHLGYLTKTQDGRILKSSTVYIRDEDGAICGIFAVNYDITGMLMAQSALGSLLATGETEAEHEPERIAQNVNDLLDELIEQSVKLVGKPAPLMTKDDKIKAIQFLSNTGAFLITKSGDKVSRYFGISKYTLYSYIDASSDAAKK